MLCLHAKLDTQWKLHTQVVPQFVNKGEGYNGEREWGRNTCIIHSGIPTKDGYIKINGDEVKKIVILAHNLLWRKLIRCTRH